MFCHIAWFEIRFWLRSWLLWIFLLVIAVLVCGFVTSDKVTADLGLANVYRNAPFAVATYYGITAVFTLLMTAIFVNSAALRDSTHNTRQIIFSTPLRRRDFLLGRFVGAAIISIVPMLGVSVGILLARYMPWANAEWGPVSWTAHLKSILLFALPDTFLLIETLAQYSALMVLDKEYGHDMTRKLLEYDMDRYLSGRGHDRVQEHPLVTVEDRQYYIFYQKGAVAMYYLKEMIGEDAVNRALQKLIHDRAYARSPYPTSYALLDALREETPSNLQYLIKDLFEDITVFSNRTLQATAVKRPDGGYDVVVDVEARKFKDDRNGNEIEVPVDDWIDIGAFAKPASGKTFGDTLYRERMHITQRNSTFTFTTSQLPDKRGIDPFSLLINRIPNDNVTTVTLESGSRSAL
jgi:hypothetical protein